jgi:DNA repair protein RecN (Recombination protein N)
MRCFVASSIGPGVRVLEQLTVRNFAIIDHVQVDFAPGLNVLTGETGAGKSIVVGALSLLRGARADTQAIRTGTDESVITGVFRISENADARAWLSEHSIEPEGGTILIRRTTKKAGRGSIYIESVPVTRGELAELAATLFDIHGQHEHQTLVDETHHRILLDRFAGIEAEVAELRSVFVELGKRRKEQEEITASERQRLQELDVLKFAVDEINAAALREGEEEELQQERRILNEHEKLFGSLDGAYGQTAESRGGALAQLRQGRVALQTAAEIDPELAEAAKRMDEAYYELEDIAETIRDYQGRVQFSPARLEEVEDRLSQIHRLEKKYGATVADVVAYADDARRRIERYEHWEEDKEALATRIAELEADLRQRAQTVSQKRRTAAETLGDRIQGIVRKLGMPKTSFKVVVDPKTSEGGRPLCGASGMDEVAFRIAPNPGEPLKRLVDIASGGEVSRVMLAVKTVLAEIDHMHCLVFDEIDAGIGGEVAVAVGQHLHELAGTKQVLCITHLASIAARADNHMKVEKSFGEDRTTTRVVAVADDKRVEEIARMLAGDQEAQASRTHAEELLRRHEASTR